MWVINTDAQVLAGHPCSNKMQIGLENTRGLGCGGNPEVGRVAAEESAEGLKKVCVVLLWSAVSTGSQHWGQSGLLPPSSHVLLLLWMPAVVITLTAASLPACCGCCLQLVAGADLLFVTAGMGGEEGVAAAGTVGSTCVRQG